MSYIYKYYQYINKNKHRVAENYNKSLCGLIKKLVHRLGKSSRATGARGLVCAVLAGSHIALAEERILIVGDSHFYGEFGTGVHRGLHELFPGAMIHSIAACGFGMQTWVRGGKTVCGYKERRGAGETLLAATAHAVTGLKTLLAQRQPTLLVIALGDNMGYLSSRIRAKGLHAIENLMRAGAQPLSQLLDTATRPRCFWITPAFGGDKTGAELAAVARGIAQGVDHTCQIIDSSQLMSVRDAASPREIHLPAAAALRWGRRAASAIGDELKKSGGL